MLIFLASVSLALMDSKIEVGGNYTYAIVQPSNEDSSQGSLGGAQAIYEYRPANRFYGGAKVSWKQGDTDGSDAKRSLLYIDTQERLGYTLSWKVDDYRLSLFSGLGYRYLQQHVTPQNLTADSFNGSFFPPYLTSATDTTLKYDELYIPVGAIADFRINSSASIGIYFTWMPQIFPMADIVPLGNAYWALTHQLANFLVEVPLTFFVKESKRWLFTVKPTYEYWQDGASKAKTSTGIPLDLPGNTYQFFGVDLDFSYIF